MLVFKQKSCAIAMADRLVRRWETCGDNYVVAFNGSTYRVMVEDAWYESQVNGPKTDVVHTAASTIGTAEMPDVPEYVQ